MEWNLADVFETVAAAVPEREAIVWRDVRRSYADLDRRADRLAAALRNAGLGARQPDRAGLSGHESHQDHVAVYLYNGPEYLETMLAGFKARVAPFNVNYRYVTGELRYLLEMCRARAIVFDGRFADTLATVLPELPELTLLIQVGGGPLLPGAVAYEDLLADADASGESDDSAAARAERSPDDLYILCTGGTTGMPKGVLWRQADIFVASMGGRAPDSGTEFATANDIAENARRGGAKLLPAPPFMHGAGHWLAFNAFTNGHTVVIQDEVTRLDAPAIWELIEREQVQVLLLVGDAFGRPLIDALEAGDHDASSLLAVTSGGAPLNPTIKDRFLAAIPSAMVLDAVGASETGSQMSHVSAAGASAASGTFRPGPGTVVVSPSMDRVLAPGHDGDGWLAQTGRVPLGYLGDPDKTAATFPTIDGTRHAVPGDRARLLPDGQIELLGRDSVTINTGGEKVFAEEVEQAIAHHRDVFDVVVAGRPSEQWGNEVVAIVALRDGVAEDPGALTDEAARHIARYKLPKAYVFVDEVVRSPAGKADYRWAAAVAGEATKPT